MEQQVLGQVAERAAGRGVAVALPHHDQVAIARLLRHAAIDVVVDQSLLERSDAFLAHDAAEQLQPRRSVAPHRGAALGKGRSAFGDDSRRDEARDAGQRAAHQVGIGRARQAGREAQAVGGSPGGICMNEDGLVAHARLLSMKVKLPSVVPVPSQVHYELGISRFL